MKFLSVLILVFCPSLLFSQINYRGKFCSMSLGEGGVTCINFKENNKFDYQVSGCLGISCTGTGNFQIIDSSLILRFSKQNQILKSRIEINEKPKFSNNQAKLQFEIFDNEASPIYPILIKRESDNKVFSQTNKSNKIIIEADKTLNIEEYEIDLIGFERVNLKVDTKTDKFIKVYLAEAPPLVISNKVMRYKLSKMTPYTFSIGGAYTDKFRLVEY